MNKYLLISLIALSFVLTAEAQKADNRNKENRSVIEVVERLAEAGIKRDVGAVDEIYADGYFHTNADGSLMTKADVLKSYQAPPGSVKIESNTHDEDRIQIMGDTAVLSTRVTYKGTADNQSFTRFYRVTYVLKKKRGWRVVASHASIIMN